MSEALAQALHTLAKKVSNIPEMQSGQPWTIWRDGWRVGKLRFLTFGPVMVVNGLATTCTLGLYSPEWFDMWMGRVADARREERR